MAPPVIDTEQSLRSTDGPAKMVRADQGVPLAAGGTLTATNVQDAIDQLAAVLSSPGGGGIGEAPTDGQLYGRQSSAWNVVPSGLSDAPSDGTTYGRKNATWVAASDGTVPENLQSANYTTVLADAGKFLYHPASDANARTITIASNASVAYTIGTVISFINLSANALTIAIATDTMYLAGPGTTGSRTLAQYGCATALKVDTTTWIISGTGLT